MIIDCHCHAGRGDGLTGPWDTAAPLGKYIARADAAGIRRTVLFPAFHSDYRTANREVARIVAQSNGRFIGFAFVHPHADRGRMQAMIDEAVHVHGFRGIKVHRYNASITREVCAAAKRWSLPILYDVMGEVSQVELIASEYAGVNFIIPHLGSFADDWRAQRAFLDILTRYPNVHTDTSGVRRFDLLEEALHRAGARKILFGSDGPWLHPGVELAKVRALGMSPQYARLVLGGNILRLISQVSRNPVGSVHFGAKPSRPMVEPNEPWLQPSPATQASVPR